MVKKIEDKNKLLFFNKNIDAMRLGASNISIYDKAILFNVKDK